MMRQERLFAFACLVNLVRTMLGITAHRTAAIADAGRWRCRPSRGRRSVIEKVQNRMLDTGDILIHIHPVGGFGQSWA